MLPALPLPTKLAGTTVLVKDSIGVERFAPLFFVSPGQINYLIPPEMATGTATIVVTSSDGAVSIGNLTIDTVGPGVFAANSDGRGAPAGFAIRVKANDTQSSEAILRFDEGLQRFVPAPIDFGPSGDQIVLVLFGTGFRYRSSLAAVTCLVGGVAVDVGYAGAQGSFVGLDQLNVSLPRTLGKDADGAEVLAANGRYGPYVKRGDDFRSLENEDRLFTVTLDEALTLLAQPKARQRREAAITRGLLGPVTPR